MSNRSETRTDDDDVDDDENDDVSGQDEAKRVERDS